MSVMIAGQILSYQTDHVKAFDFKYQFHWLHSLYNVDTLQGIKVMRKCDSAFPTGTMHTGVYIVA